MFTFLYNLPGLAKLRNDKLDDVNTKLDTVIASLANLEAGTNIVKSVQYVGGTTQLGDGSSVDVAISSVDTNRAVVMLNTSYSIAINSAAVDKADSLNVILLNATTVRFERTSSGIGNAIRVAAVVIEFQ